jgi:hypothetical protein
MCQCGPGYALLAQLLVVGAGVAHLRILRIPETTVPAFAGTVVKNFSGGGLGGPGPPPAKLLLLGSLLGGLLGGFLLGLGHDQHSGLLKLRVSPGFKYIQQLMEYKQAC